MHDTPPQRDARWRRLIDEMRANQGAPEQREPPVQWALWLVVVPLVLLTTYLALLAYGVNSGGG